MTTSTALIKKQGTSILLNVCPATAEQPVRLCIASGGGGRGDPGDCFGAVHLQLMTNGWAGTRTRDMAGTVEATRKAREPKERLRAERVRRRRRAELPDMLTFVTRRRYRA